MQASLAAPRDAEHDANDFALISQKRGASALLTRRKKKRTGLQSCNCNIVDQAMQTKAFLAKERR